MSNNSNNSSDLPEIILELEDESSQEPTDQTQKEQDSSIPSTQPDLEINPDQDNQAGLHPEKDDMPDVSVYPDEPVSTNEEENRVNFSIEDARDSGDDSANTPEQLEFVDLFQDTLPEGRDLLDSPPVESLSPNGQAKPDQQETEEPAQENELSPEAAVETILPEPSETKEALLPENKSSEQSEEPVFHFEPETPDIEPERSETDQSPPDRQQIIDELTAKGWTVYEHQRCRAFVLDCEEGAFLLAGNTVSQGKDIKNFPEHLLYFVDYYQSQGPGVTTFDGKTKYAKILIQKKLEQEGELSEEFELHFLASHKISGSRTEFLYHLLPIEKHNALLHLCAQTRHGFLLFDITVLLYSILARTRNKAAALILHLPGSALFLAGKLRQGFIVRRFVLAEGNEQSLLDVLYACSQLLGTKEWGKTIRHIDWLESLTANPIWPANPPREQKFHRWPLFVYDFNGQPYFSSLPEAIRRLDKRLAFNPRSELIGLKIEKLEKFLYAAIFGLTCMFGISAYQFNNSCTQLEQNNINLQRQVSSLARQIRILQKPLQSIHPPSKDELEQIAALARDIKKATLSPRLSIIWNDLASITPEICRIGAIDIKYHDNHVEIRLEGMIVSDLVQAQSIFTSYLSALEKKNFVIIKKNIQLSLDNNLFKLTLTRKYVN